MAFKGAKKRTRSMNNPANSLFLPTASTAIEALDRKDILRYLYVPLIGQRNSRLVELRTPSLSEYPWRRRAIWWRQRALVIFRSFDLTCIAV